MKLVKLVIDRAKWGTGALENKDGTMCCLGFLAKACGYTNLRRDGEHAALGDVTMGYPLSTWTNIPLPFVPDDLSQRDPVWRKAAEINDNTRLPLVEKEAMLIKLFADNGIELSFEGVARD